MVNLSKYKTLNYCIQGASHVRSNKPCQDFSDVFKDNKKYIVAAVADGHGGDEYCRSDRGSRFAVSTFIKCIKQALSRKPGKKPAHFIMQNTASDFSDAILQAKTDKELDERMQWLFKSILTNWKLTVQDDLENSPFTSEELACIPEKAREHYSSGDHVKTAYGTTLLGALVTTNFCLLMQIGDGTCVVFDDSLMPSEPIPEDSKCCLNTTTSLCDINAQHEFRYRILNTIPAAVFLTSDGIENSFKRADMHNFFRTILKSFAQSDDTSAEKELQAALPVISNSGSGDDLSLSVIFNSKKIKRHFKDSVSV